MLQSRLPFLNCRKTTGHKMTYKFLYDLLNFFSFLTNKLKILWTWASVKAVIEKESRVQVILTREKSIKSCVLFSRYRSCISPEGANLLNYCGLRRAWLHFTLFTCTYWNITNLDLNPFAGRCEHSNCFWRSNCK